VERKEDGRCGGEKGRWEAWWSAVAVLHEFFFYFEKLW
jgi:hypothetical protein